MKNGEKFIRALSGTFMMDTKIILKYVGVTDVKEPLEKEMKVTIGSVHPDEIGLGHWKSSIEYFNTSGELVEYDMTYDIAVMIPVNDFDEMLDKIDV